MFESEDYDRCLSTDGGEALRDIIEKAVNLQKPESQTLPVKKEEEPLAKNPAASIKATRGLFLSLIEKISGVMRSTRTPPIDMSSRRAPEAHIYRASPLSAKKKEPAKDVAPWARL